MAKTVSADLEVGLRVDDLGDDLGCNRGAAVDMLLILTIDKVEMAIIVATGFL
jgi:hypothetical protein